MKICKKILLVMLIVICSICIFVNIEATSIGVSSTNINVGQSVTITVTVPNVNTVDLTAMVSGAGISDEIRIVDGSMTGEAKNFSKSLTVTPTSEGTISVVVSGDSNAVLNGQYVNVAASQNISVTKPAPAPDPTPAPVTPPATNNNTNTNTQVNNNANTSAKSSNNYLKTLQVSEEGLTPNFVKTKTNYTLSVSEKVTSINVNAKAEDSAAKVTISGNENLKDGDNNVYITVIAENGSKRTYTIVVNKSADPVKSNSFLSNLIIKDMALTPEFSTEILEYDGGTIKTNSDKLEIYAYPTNENAKLEIIGNENLKVGENTITIKVTSEDGTSTKDYVIKFIKEEVFETQALEQVSEEEDNKDGFFKSLLKEIWLTIKANALLLLLYFLVVVEFVEIVYLYKKLKKKESELENNIKSEEKVEDLNSDENLALDEVQEEFKLDKIDIDALLGETQVDSEENINNIEEQVEEKIDIVNEEENTQEETIVEEPITNDIQDISDVPEEPEIKSKVRTIWDEDDKPDFSDLEFLDDDITDGKRRRGGR